MVGNGTCPATGGGGRGAGARVHLRRLARPRHSAHDGDANCDVLEAEASDQAGLASWVANIRAAADEMATRIADMLMHMGGD
ncbi:MAG: hypothetical protein Q3X49_00240 [Slackia sp.]|uniref:hypothetical protein n=1 Tax=Slackia sp. TaxID=2049041 RepID=UPI002852383F|nr:hypothetical protein [Slackia sp.]MDR3899525.1 hypothetical protein [Slackia sp.]